MVQLPPSHTLTYNLLMDYPLASLIFQISFPFQIQTFSLVFVQVSYFQRHSHQPQLHLVFGAEVPPYALTVMSTWGVVRWMEEDLRVRVVR